jgi:hypothetical protein
MNRHCPFRPYCREADARALRLANPKELQFGGANFPISGMEMLSSRRFIAGLSSH